MPIIEAGGVVGAAFFGWCHSEGDKQSYSLGISEEEVRMLRMILMLAQLWLLLMTSLRVIWEINDDCRLQKKECRC